MPKTDNPFGSFDLQQLLNLAQGFIRMSPAGMRLGQVGSEVKVIRRKLREGLIEIGMLYESDPDPGVFPMFTNLLSRWMNKAAGREPTVEETGDSDDDKDDEPKSGPINRTPPPRDPRHKPRGGVLITDPPPGGYNTGLGNEDNAEDADFREV